MILVRNTMRAKFGKGEELAKMMVAAMQQMVSEMESGESFPGFDRSLGSDRHGHDRNRGGEPRRLGATAGAIDVAAWLPTVR
jgi:hypothetical protein